MSKELEQALAAWEAVAAGASAAEAGARARAQSALVRAIAAGRAVSPSEFAAEVGISDDAAREVFRGFEASGLELDGEGRVVGAALTPRPTPHRMIVGGKDLYAWCALDTLFIPGLLDEVADVRSPCAVSGQEIHLRVTPHGVESFEPPHAVLSVVLPGVGCAPGETGPESPT